MPEPAETASDVSWPDAGREAAFSAWIEPLLSPHRLVLRSLRSASSDASFRRYLRIDMEGPGGSSSGDQSRAVGGIVDTPARSLIVMDAPPPQEDVRPFVAVAAQLEQAGLIAPRVLAQDAERGFLLLTDLGSTLYLQALHSAVATGDTAGAERLMRTAGSTLVAWQQRIDARLLPPCDEALLRRELQLFPDWCVERELGVVWSVDDAAVWAEACDLLVGSALSQATIAVHRDYMPRNLMLTPDGPGILDFQDAVRGPIGYDVASLIRDAFISWDEATELDIAVRYWQQARRAELPVPDDFGEFWRQVEWVGLQRHLKVLGIFCRLKHRDGKPKYSADLPRFFGYAHHVASRYNALRPLSRLLEPLMGATRIDAYY